MELFDSVFGRGNNAGSSFTNKESFAGMIVAMAAANGNVSNDKIEDLKFFIYKSKTLSKTGDQEYSNIIKKVFRVLRTKGVDTLLSLSIAGLSKELHKGVFTSVCDLAYSDGFVENKERAMIDKIRIAFDIPNDEVLAIVKVIAAKNSV